MLSCTCEEEYENARWWYSLDTDIDFIKLNTKRGRRCCSCNKLIKKGETCLPFERFRYAKEDSIEEKIHGDTEIQIATHYMCEDCGDQYLNLSQHYCIDITKNMFDLLEEHKELNGL